MLPSVLVTGGARRIGATIARSFGLAGWHVVIHHKDSHDEAEALAAELPTAEVVQCDLGDIEASAAMIEVLTARLDDWRVLVNCAAVFHEDTVRRLDPAVFEEAVTVNAATPARMAQVFLAGAKAKGGRRVIDVTDMKIANPNPDFFSYTMAKHAFDATVRMMAMAQESTADRIYGLAPGAMLPSFDQLPEEHLKSGRMNLLERLTDPQELADAALFLAEGWLASGETLFVDSGQHLLSLPRDVLFLARE
ncbi:SDR family oxidoreductase [Novosphingobium sp. G106]|uniref:SDR family oxidoreductase n=1 Tax=Novosphingobium sp. G106 TaxID=2849500 RepID=UPI001C2D7D45|nr:SDR family oxidoreductase [Novosphingobium sp. G106]MBV1691762.1 SDR family oxidoreductase [Novosphingobium sp. G106]